MEKVERMRTLGKLEFSIEFGGKDIQRISKLHKEFPKNTGSRWRNQPDIHFPFTI